MSLEFTTFNTTSIPQEADQTQYFDEENIPPTDEPDSQDRRKAQKSDADAETYPPELAEWVENNLDMKLCSDSKGAVEEYLSRHIISFNEVKDKIWDGTLPVRIAQEITVLCKDNFAFGKVLYGRWFDRLNFPFQSHNRDYLWTAFKLSIPCDPPADKEAFKQRCLECWRGCVAFVDTPTDSQQYVILKILQKGAVCYKESKYKDFLGTLKSLVSDKLGIDLVELFEQNLHLFTYTSLEKNMFSFDELARKWHPDCLYLHVGSFVERSIPEVPSQYQARRFAEDLKSINDLIRYYCDNQEALAVHFKKIIAWKLQHLSERTGVAIVIASPQNCLKSGFVRWIVTASFGPDVLKSIKGGFWGILKDNYAGALLEGFSVIQADEIGSKPLPLEDLEAFKNICDDQNTTHYARAIRANWAKQTQNLEIWITSNFTEPHTFPFVHMYSPYENNRRILPLVNREPIPRALFERCLNIFQKSNPLLMRLFIEDCHNLLAGDPAFVPNKDIPLTPFIEQLRSISIHSLLVNYFQQLPQNVREMGRIPTLTVAKALSSKVGTKIDSKALKPIFKTIPPGSFPFKSIKIKSGQNIPAVGESKRQTNVSAFVWVV